MHRHRPAHQPYGADEEAYGVIEGSMRSWSLGSRKAWNIQDCHIPQEVPFAVMILYAWPKMVYGKHLGYGFLCHCYTGGDGSPTKTVSEMAEGFRKDPKSPVAASRRLQEPASPPNPIAQQATAAFQILRQLHTFYRASKMFLTPYKDLGEIQSSTQALYIFLAQWVILRSRCAMKFWIQIFYDIQNDLSCPFWALNVLHHQPTTMGEHVC